MGRDQPDVASYCTVRARNHAGGCMFIYTIIVSHISSVVVENMYTVSDDFIHYEL